MKHMVTCMMMGLLFAAGAAATTRDEVPEAHKWNLNDIYPTEDAFLKAREAFAASIPQVAQYKGKLAENPQTLKACLDTVFDMYKTYGRLSSYASLTADQNLKESEGQKMRQETRQIGIQFSAATAWIQPEILAMGEEKIRSFMKEEAGLDIYHMYLEEMIRTARHTLSEKEETLLSRTGLLSGTPYNAYSIFTNADMEFPTITLHDGTEVKLSQAAYGKYRTSPNREDRETVFKGFFGTYKQYSNTLGTLLYAGLQRDWFYASTRKYDTCVEAALDGNNVPVAVYDQLLEDIHKNLPSLHRYLKLRQKMMGLDELKYSDLYPSLVKEVDLKYPVDDSIDLVLKAMAPLGSEYTDALAVGLKSRWADVYPTEGKRSGAYSNGSIYDVHPYVLLNHNDDYDSLSTMAHEFGHAMHSYFSNKNQPFATSDYSIFVAEVASTFNENLLNNYLLKNTDDPKVKLFLLGNALERIRTTIFRQAMFAEFERKTHALVEKGEALTGERFSQIYLDLVREYYGDEQGVCKVDELYGNEWAFIPHFYYNYYVYQYATGLVAATALSEKVIEGEDGAAQRYLNFLKSGSSDYPINILRKAGADLETPEPFDITMKVFNRIMDQIEATLKEMEQK